MGLIFRDQYVRLHVQRAFFSLQRYDKDVTLNLSLVKYGLFYIKEQRDLLHNTFGRIYQAYLFIDVYFIWDYRVYHFLAPS